MMIAAGTPLDIRYHTAPAFPDGFREIEGVPVTRDQYRLIAARLDTLRKAYAKHTRWLEACALYSLGAADAPNVRTMPSKDAKHRMYGVATELAYACGWGLGAEVRCHNLDDIACLIATVESMLRGR